MADTAIGWTHRPGTRGRTWNPVRGCRRKSAGCEHCYAERLAERIVRMGKGKPTPYDGLVKLVNGEPRWTGEIALDADRLAEPLRWRQPSTIFVDSMSDLFYDKRPDEHIAAVFGVMAATRHITYQILTKYAQRMRAWFGWVDRSITRHWHGRWGVLFEHLQTILGEHATDAAWQRAIAHEPTPTNLGDAGCHAWPLPNVWLGVSVENQDAADERIPDLLDTPAAVRFLSCEPLLGRLNLTLHGSRVRDWDEDLKYDVLKGLAWTSPREWAEEAPPARGKDPRIDWVIDGCESGPDARPADPAWFASLEAQCRAAGVAYFHKQEVVDGKLVHDFPGRQEFPEAR